MRRKEPEPAVGSPYLALFELSEFRPLRLAPCFRWVDSGFVVGHIGHALKEQEDGVKDGAARVLDEE